MSIEFYVSSLTFSSGQTVELNSGDIVVFVGPNNCGKTEALAAIERKAAKQSSTSPVLMSATFNHTGSVEELTEWLDMNCILLNPGTGNERYSRSTGQIHKNNIENFWTSNHYGGLAQLLVNRATTVDRLTAANPPAQIARLTEPLTHPIHYLQEYSDREEEFSKHFRRAFNKDVIVHPGAGSQVPLFVGDRPPYEDGEHPYSSSWMRKLEKLDPLHEQGDGIRSFAGSLLQATVDSYFVLLIDEPEAFLHPPQATLLGEILANEKADDSQLFLATHSGEFLRGLLSANSGNVRVVRIRREGAANHVTQLDATGVRQLWSDPLLRYSDLLDGLFHERVVVCEADSDCQFYEAILAATTGAEEGVNRPDLKFTHCGGKSRIPLVVRSLRALDVPVSVIVDFDILQEEYPLRSLVEGLDGDWADFQETWRFVKESVDGKNPSVKTADVKKAITDVLNGVEGDKFPVDASRQIRNALRGITSWQIAKEQGVSWIPPGQPRSRCNQLLNQLIDLGIHVVPVGELEGFCRSEGGHGPRFVASALQKDLASDPELEAARNFVSILLKSKL